MYLKAFATVTFGDSLVVRNIAIVQKNGTDELFVSMPDYRTEKYRDGKPVYREIVFPVTKEFRERLYGALEKEYVAEREKTQEKGDPEPEKKQEKTATRKAKEKETKVAR